MSSAATAQLDVKALISTGIFTALYFVLLAVGAMISLLNPFMMFVGPLVAILLSGPVIMLFLEKVRTPWAFVILGFIIGALMMLIGRVWYCILVAPFAALLGDLIARSGNYRKRSLNLLGYSVFALWTVTPLAPILYDTDNFLGHISGSMGASYAKTLGEIFTPAGMGLFAVCVFVCAALSAWVGAIIIRKHFQTV
ncbi:MptD family putative ECF transporter S component [Boudabousia marimammalium]|uniref:Uncharacterized protein n=1 Tax=Boudabousia marimammalium TaxID=156892 RepID=A0A1Q5PSD7_9ACTO|nr:MptD family putative ECF transporter S component [Boudabousia marimammalium]OKL50498.1 hypothetical protein BM477_00550 [Boudabousia marimammalium]